MQKKSSFDSKPWITKGLQNAIKKKNLLYKQFVKSRTPESEMKYKKNENKLLKIIRTNKEHYYNNLLEINQGNSKGTWHVINNIIKGKKDIMYPQYFKNKDLNTINNQNVIVQEFNDYFANVGCHLAKTIEEPKIIEGVGLDLIDNNTNSIFIEPVKEHELLKVVATFKGKYSTDYNDINMKLVKDIISYIVKPLTYIFNLSFQSRIFPDNMKIAKVIPIYKSGDRHNFTNYRPISFLPQFSKILEKLYELRLSNFLEKYELLTDNQYGFRKKRSTELAIMEMVERITTAVEIQEHSIGIFVDLKKAFDTIDHDILLKN